MSTPHLSVIVAAYNAERTIGETLGSLQRESYRDFEVIVVDDGSTDGTAELVESFRRENFPLRLLRQTNAGPSVARNHAASVAKGSWLAMLDADDAALPWHLQLLVEASRAHPDAGLLSGTTTWFDAVVRSSSAAETERSVDPPKGFDPSTARLVALRDFARDNPICTSASMARAEAFAEAGGFDPRLWQAEDYDLWMRIAALYPVVKFEQPLTRYRVRPEGLSLDFERFAPQVEQVLRKAFGPGGALSRYPECYRTALAFQYAHLSWMAFQTDTRARALRLLARSVGYGLWGRLRGGGQAPEDWLPCMVRYLVGKRASMDYSD